MEAFSPKKIIEYMVPDFSISEMLGLTFNKMSAA